MKLTKVIGASLLSSVFCDIVLFDSECINDSERYTVAVDDNFVNLPVSFECDILGDATLARISSRSEFDIARDLLERTEELKPLLSDSDRVYVGIMENPPANSVQRIPTKFSFVDNFADRSYIHSEIGVEPWNPNEPNAFDDNEWCVM